MIEVTVFSLVMAALAGTVLGLAFFGGLRWTVLRAAVSPRPALWFGPSLLLRSALACAGFYFVGDGTWQRLAACMAGFLLARATILRLAQKRSHAS